MAATAPGATPQAATGVRSSTIFVGNIPYDAEEEELREIFGRAGKVESLRLVFDRDTRQPKGYGFCDYADPDVAITAIKTLSDVDFKGRKLRIDLADNAFRNKMLSGSKAPGLLALPAPSSAPTANAPLPPLPRPAPQQPLPPMTHIRAAPGQALLPTEPLLGRAEDPGPTAAEIAAQVSSHSETLQIVSSMPKAQLQVCLASMQRLAIEAPEQARAMLQDHPQLCYALLHAQMLLGLDLEPMPPPDDKEVERLKIEAAVRQPFGAGIGLLPGGLPAGVPRMNLAPLLGLLGNINSLAGLQAGLGGLPLGGMPNLQGMQLGALGVPLGQPRPAPPIGQVLPTRPAAPLGPAGIGLAAKGAPPRPNFPQQLRPGMVLPAQPMDVG